VTGGSTGVVQPEVLEQMIASGMNIARINFAHGNFETHRRNITNIRTAAKKGRATGGHVWSVIHKSLIFKF
jgi:pyruvate kinase